MTQRKKKATKSALGKRALSKKLKDALSAYAQMLERNGLLNNAITRGREDRDVLKQGLIDARMREQRLLGYIDRVKEEETGIVRDADYRPRTTTTPVTAEDIIKMPDTEFSKMIENLPQDKLDRMMGRSDDDDDVGAY